MAKKDDPAFFPAFVAPETALMSLQISDGNFQKISCMIYDLCGINLHTGKKELVQARLNKRLRKLGLRDYGDYLRFVEEDPSGTELVAMVDSLTTNLTYFFREYAHFEYLTSWLENFNSGTPSRLRIWSAGCSSGEEAYSLAITLREAIPNIDMRMDTRILATDISTKVLSIAKHGLYADNRFKDTPSLLRDRYFSKYIQPNGGEVFFKANKSINSLISFRRLNLIGDDWPMRGQFDVVFCRNVMIYFDKKTQGELIERFFNIIRPGGIFIVGHSESLTGIKHGFKYVKPSIYSKP